MIRPTGNKILIAIEAPKSDFVKKDGIYVPGKTNHGAIQGTIIALGSGIRDQKGKITPFEVAVGDVILIGEYSGMEVKLEDKRYYLITEEEILGKLVNE